MFVVHIEIKFPFFVFFCLDKTNTFVNNFFLKIACSLFYRMSQNVKTLWDKEVKTKTGKPFTKMYWCQKPVSQYYIYINDDILGLCYLKISSYYPFYCEFYCNGHQYLKREFEKRNIPFKMNDNSFVEIGDIKKTEELINSFSGSQIEERIKLHWDEWFNFHKGERSRRNDLLQHQWFTTQAEICSNVIFKSAKFFDALYDRIVEKHHRIGLPHTLTKIFDLKKERKHSESRQRLYYQKVCIKHWIQGNSIKMYNKGGYLLRVETTINNPRLPGATLHKPVYNIKGYYWYGHGCNNRFLGALADTDINSVSENNEKLTQTIVNEKGKKIAASDFRKQRQLELIAVLLNARYASEWFQIKELYPLLTAFYSKPAKIRYEMQKFIERGLVEKRQGTNYYRVTKEGYCWFLVSYCQRRYFINPLQSKLLKKELRKKLDNPDNFELAYERLNQGIELIYQELGIAA